MNMLPLKIGTGVCAIAIAIGAFAGVPTHTAHAFSLNASAEASIRGVFSKWADSWRGWYTARPAIDEIRPDQGAIGTTVTLTGERFDDDSIVRFGPGIIDDVTVAQDGEMLSFVVPAELDRYCMNKRFCADRTIDVEADDYRIIVQNGYRFSNAVTFEVTEEADDPSDEPLAIDRVIGPTALEQGAEGTWTVEVSHEDDASLRYSVKWGDEGNFLARLFAQDERMQSSATFTHTYSEPGTYQPEFTVRDRDGNTSVKLGAKVVVGETDSVPRITSVTPLKAHVGAEVTIMGSGFDRESTVAFDSVRASDVTVEDETEITFTVPDTKSGSYALTVSDNDGTSNAIDFEVIAQKGRLSINGIEAPTRLSVGETGTWTIDAATNLSGSLKYSVDWGTTMNNARGLRVLDAVTQTSATFTHAYEVEGVFKPKFTVTDEQGNTAHVSASVVVTDD